jgi:hypothetical protein
MRFTNSITISLILLVIAAGSLGCRGQEWKLVNSIPLPGVEGRFDHAAADPSTHRVFFAALGNDTLEVVDVEAGKRVHTITGLKRPTGVLFIAELNLLVVASGGDGTCRFYDGASCAERARVTVLEDADNLRFDPKAKRIYLGYAEGALGVIDPVTMRPVGRIALPKHPESFQLEADGPRIFVNVPDARQIAVVDRVTGRVVAAWPIEGAHANFPMALTEKERRLFVACRQPARLLAFDIDSGKRIAESEMSGDADDLFFDAGTSELVASCGEGFLDLFRFATPTGLSRLPRTASAPGARTSLFSAKLGALYLAIPHRGSQAAEIRSYERSGIR